MALVSEYGSNYEKCSLLLSIFLQLVKKDSLQNSIVIIVWFCFFFCRAI